MRRRSSGRTDILQSDDLSPPRRKLRSSDRKMYEDNNSDESDVNKMSNYEDDEYSGYRRSSRLRGGNDSLRSMDSSHLGGGAKSSRNNYENRQSRRKVILSEEELEEEEEETTEDEEDDDQQEGKKYSFRDRSLTKREFLNVKTLGGDGGGLRHNSMQFTRNLRTNSTSSEVRESINGRPVVKVDYRYNQRLNLGGKMANSSYHRDIRHTRNRGNNSSDSDESNSTKRSNKVSKERRHFDSSSESSESSDNNSKSMGSMHRHNHLRDADDEENEFLLHERVRREKELNSIQPINLMLQPGLGSRGGSIMDKASRRDLSRADVLPVAVEGNIGFHQVGGLDSHIMALKEMVVLPLLYPDVFSKFNTQPPRGVLFVGPPGTGKTLTARALANSLSAEIGGASSGRKVSFFMRKGADCLSKWVGEGERQLRLLFEQAKRFQPSIIFFDEIDGLAPVRSMKQDQIHASIVSTLLALMDGLDPRGQVVVIGATNRPDAIDPALRRPGRFDRELMFRLPNAAARSAIIQIHSDKWSPPLTEEIKKWLVESTIGYCGADIKALCAEAALISFRRMYPQVYSASARLNIDLSKLRISRGDLAAAMTKLIPAAVRSLSANPVKPLDPLYSNWLSEDLECATNAVANIFPPFDETRNVLKRHFLLQLSDTSSSNDGESGRLKIINSLNSVDWTGIDRETWMACLADSTENEITKKCNVNSSLLWNISNNVTSNSRLIVLGKDSGSGQEQIVSALLHQLEGFSIVNLDIPSLLMSSEGSTIENMLVFKIQEAFRTSPSVIYIPELIPWWSAIGTSHSGETIKTTILNLIESMPANLPVLWITSLSIGSSSTSVSFERIAVSPAVSGIDEDEKLTRLINFFINSENSSACLANYEEMLKSNVGLDFKLVTDNCLLLYPRSTKTRRICFEKFLKDVATIPTTLHEATIKMLQSVNESLLIATTVPSISKGEVEHLSSALDDDVSRELAFRYDEDSIQNYESELRTFFREALGNLFRSKKYSIFSRPVDPEVVPDYYDVVSSPMDLETMRMKVDNGLYPSFKFFLFDIEQIAFNAREYNPISSMKDSRGRAIVHAANSLVDEVRIHSHHFKKRLGYDLFKKCEEIYLLKLGVEKKANSGRERRSKKSENFTPYDELTHESMPLQNRIYYREILEKHVEVKEQIQKEESVMDDTLEDTPVPRRSSKRLGDADSGKTGVDSTSNSSVKADKSCDVTDRRSTRSNRVIIDVDYSTPEIDKKRKRTRANSDASSTATAVSVNEIISESPKFSLNETLQKEANISPVASVSPNEPRLQLNIDEHPRVQALVKAVSDSKVMLSSEGKLGPKLETLLMKLLRKTENFNVSRVINVMTKLNLCVKNFHTSCNWHVLIAEITDFIENL